MRDKPSALSSSGDEFEPLIAQVEKSLPGLLARLRYSKRTAAHAFLDNVVNEILLSDLSLSEVQLLLGSMATLTPAVSHRNRFFSFLQGKVAA